MPPPYFLNGRVLAKLGNSHPAMTPGNLYMAKDGTVLISTCEVAQVHRLYKIMGREDLVNSPLGANHKERIKYKEQIDTIVGEWTKTRTVNEIVNQLQAIEIVCSPVPSFDQVCNDPHLTSREMIIEVEQPVSGKVKTPGSLFKLSKTPGNVNFLRLRLVSIISRYIQLYWDIPKKKSVDFPKKA